MSNNIGVTIFHSPQFGGIRTAGTATDPLFCLSDVCKALDLQQGNVKRRLDDGLCSTQPISDSLGRTQYANFVNEDGLYDVILDSRKEEAKVFRKWVTAEILPTIRKTGGYIATNNSMSDDEIMAKAVLVAKTTIEQRNQRIKQLEVENNTQKQLIAEMQKENDYLNKILQSKGTVTTTQIAADYGLSAKALNFKLKEMKIQHKVNGQWILYSPFIGKGYLHSRTISITHKDGTLDTRMTSEWTQRGRIFLYDALKELGIIPLIEQH